MSKPPLWQVLMNAGNPPCSMQEMAAAEIRAVRDWLVPEKEPPLGPADKQNMHLRALLTAEADRAERGETADD